jgi:hypothetical protein
MYIRLRMDARHFPLIPVMRKFVDEVLYPDAQLCEENGKRASKAVLDAMA